MRISVVIPTRNYSGDLEKCFASIEKQSRKPFEKIVVVYPNGGVERAAKKYGFKVFYDTKRTIGNAYNVGARSAKGDIILFVDDDSTAPRKLLESIEKAFKENPDMDVIGGDDILPSSSSAFQKAAYQTDKATRPKEKKKGNTSWKWLRAACIAYRKSSLRKQNFDKRLIGLQEPELHARMRKTGMKALYDPSIFVYHKRRNSLTGIWNQIYRNGKAKVDFIRLHPEVFSFYDIAPFIFTAYSSILIYSGRPVLLFASIIFYFLLKTFLISLKSGEIKHYPFLLFVLITKEIAYSFGIIVGIFKTWGRL
jgi:glycosyltransferase involved in cell wall biosynthesis